MPFVVTPPLPFPSLSWWSYIVDASPLLFDTEAFFEKMSCRNRYDIGTANGRLLLSIPLAKGRNQRVPLKEVHIYNREKWQQQHWRTITSAYNRSPFFEYYGPGLQRLYTTEYELLTDFCTDSINWLAGVLNIKTEATLATGYQEQYDGATDLRAFKKADPVTPGFPEYYQVFAERNGFLPDLSVLDLLFSEGPYASKWLAGNKGLILDATKAAYNFR